MKLKYLSLVICAFALTSCTKVEVVAPNFDVVPSVFEVTEDEEVTFTFSGDPDQISFYSGEILKDYAFKDGRIIESNGLFASFKSHAAYGTHPDLLSVWVSTDFNGNYTIEDIAAATWDNEITKTFTLAPNSINSTAAAAAVPSGERDLSPQLVEGKPLYFAFRYKKTPDNEGGTQRNWFVRDLSIASSTILGKQSIATGGDFSLVYDRNFDSDPATKNSSINAAGTMTLRVPSALGALHTEVWAVSAPLNIGKVDMGPDKPVAIKGFVDTRVNEYKYIYETPGVYKATFVASNSNIYGAEAVVREVEITVLAKK